jgi:transketolase
MADEKIIENMEDAALRVKLNLLELCNKTIMHIGGDMSVSDMMIAIWKYAMCYDISNPTWEGRDRFVLSKGHAAAVTTFCQAEIGCYDVDEIFAEYATDFGRFGMHSCNLINPYVDVSTGSLGHGLSIGAGIATALKKKNLDNRVYVVIGDGELAEGSIWEAAMSAAHYKLGNLVVFMDRNYLSFDGYTEELMALEPIEDKWKSFGWNTVVIDGHDMGQIIDAIDNLPNVYSEKPTVVIGKTVKGHGIDFMENSAGWHAGLISDELLNEAKQNVIKSFEEKRGA